MRLPPEPWEILHTNRLHEHVVYHEGLKQIRYWMRKPAQQRVTYALSTSLIPNVEREQLDEYLPEARAWLGADR
jgi:hypothetical protein